MVFKKVGLCQLLLKKHFSLKQISIEEKKVKNIFEFNEKFIKNNEIKSFASQDEIKKHENKKSIQNIILELTTMRNDLKTILKKNQEVDFYKNLYSTSDPEDEEIDDPVEYDSKENKIESFDERVISVSSFLEENFSKIPISSIKIKYQDKINHVVKNEKTSSNEETCEIEEYIEENGKIISHLISRQMDKYIELPFDNEVKSNEENYTERSSDEMEEISKKKKNIFEIDLDDFMTNIKDSLKKPKKSHEI